MASIEKRALAGSVAGIVNFGTIVIQNLLLVPVFLAYWGNENYGVWLSLLAAQAILQTIDVGHQTYVGNELNRAAYADQREFGCVLGSGLVVATILGFLQIALVMLIVFAGLLPAFLGSKYTLPVGTGLALGILVIAWELTGAVGGILVRAYAPIGRFARGIWWGVAIRLAQVAGLGISVWSGAGLAVAASAYAVAGGIVAVFMLRDVRNQLRGAGLWHMSLDFRLGIRNLRQSLVVCVNGFVDQCGLNGLVLLVGHMASVSTIPIFTTLRTLANTAMQATNIVLQPVATDLVRMHVSRRAADISETLSVAWMFSCGLINFLMILGLPFASVVYDTWVHRRIAFDELTFALFIWSVALRNFGAPLVLFLTANNNLAFQTAATLARNGIALGGGVIGLLASGLRGMAIALVAAELVGSVVIPMIYARRELMLLEGKMDSRSIFLALCEQFIIAVLMGSYAVAPNHRSLLAFGAAALLLLIATLRWHALTEPIRGRLLATLSRV